MTNIYSEIFLIIVGWFVLYKVAKRHWGNNKTLIYIFFITYIIDVIIVMLSERGSMHFGDGYDYYLQGKFILDNYGVSLSTFTDIKVFINVSQSWHFVPTYEFALFQALFHSTKCISIFHIIIMHCSFVVWYQIFIEFKFDKKICERATLFMILSLYLQNFTIPALKDPLVFALVSMISKYIVKFYYCRRHKILFQTIVPLTILMFTRMYVACALIISMFICIIMLMKNRMTIRNLIGIMGVLIVGSIIGFLLIRNGDLLTYINRWVNEYDLGIMGLIVSLIKRTLEFCFAPLIFNIMNAQSLYYPTYIESSLRLLLCPALIYGIISVKYVKDKGLFFSIFLVPLLVSMVAFETGEQASAVRQYFQSYPLLCLLYARGTKINRRRIE